METNPTDATDATDALLALAEVAVGLVGFTGIVLALTRRDSAPGPGEVLQLKELIRGGLAGVGLALTGESGGVTCRIRVGSGRV